MKVFPPGSLPDTSCASDVFWSDALETDVGAKATGSVWRHATDLSVSVSVTVKPHCTARHALIKSLLFLTEHQNPFSAQVIWTFLPVEGHVRSVQANDVYI